MEPILCNSGCLLPREGFLQGARELCDAHGALLVFDEIITGFRRSLAGAQGHYGVTPDLATFGKAIGGGAPVERGRRPRGRSWSAWAAVSPSAARSTGTPCRWPGPGATLTELERDDGAPWSRPTGRASSSATASGSAPTPTGSLSA